MEFAAAHNAPFEIGWLVTAERSQGAKAAEVLDFHEVQPLKSVWLWLVIAGLTLFIWFAAFQQLVEGTPFGNDPVDDRVLFVLWLLFGVGLPIAFRSLRLVTELRQDSICIRLVPLDLRRRCFGYSAIREVRVTEYHPLRVYGRRRRTGDRAYRVSGNEGVQLALTDGRTILIGSKRANELAYALELHLADTRRRERAGLAKQGSP